MDQSCSLRGGTGLGEGKEGGRMPCDALRDPYALLTKANDTNDCDWFRNGPNWVSLLICFRMIKFREIVKPKEVK